MTTALTILIWAAAVAIGLPILFWLAVLIVGLVIAVKS